VVCGGDGTICEALNGIEGKENCALAVMPAGTGNDFIRNFYSTSDEKALFSSVDAQLEGDELLCDYMEILIDGERRKLAVNMINSGLDSEVGVRVNELRGKKLIPQTLAYYYGLVEQFIKKPCVNARVTVDGEELFDGEKILIAIGNGAYCGGGFKAATRASVCDGLLDVCIVENVTRLQFIDLVGSYKKGTHLEHKRANDLITYLKCKEILAEYANPQKVVFDGEMEICNSICVRISEKPVRIFLPKGIPPYLPIIADEAAAEKDAEKENESVSV
jgi:diacylglycerol kinase family enzyme